MTARGDARKRLAEAGNARLQESIAELEDAAALTEAERAAVNAATCGNCGERTAVLNLAARIKAEAVQTERERWLAALATGRGADMAQAMLWDAADRLDDPRHEGNKWSWPEHAAMMRNLAAEIARGES